MASFISGLCNSGAWAYLARCLLTPEAGSPFLWEGFTGRLLVLRRENSDLEDVADAATALAPFFKDAPLRPALFGDDSRLRLSSLELLRAGAWRSAASLVKGVVRISPASAEPHRRLARFTTWPRAVYSMRLRVP